MSNSWPITNPETFTRSSNTVDLLQFADDFRDEDVFNNVSIMVENECIPANKMVLSCFSEFFEDRFTREKKGEYQNKIELESVDAKAVRSLINYMYTSSIEIDHENVFKLLAAANHLQLEDVERYCFQYLRAHTTTDSWVDILQAAIKYKNDENKQHAYRYISIQFSEIAKTENFKVLSKHELKDLLSNLTRCLMHETSIYEGIMNWIKRNDDANKHDLMDLFQIIQVDRLPHEFILKILEEDLIKANNNYNHHFSTALSQARKTQNDTIDKTRIISVGGYESRKKIIEVYNLHDRKPSTYNDFPREIFGHFLLRKGDYVFCIGGSNSNGNHGEVYNRVWVALASGKDSSLMWREIAPMKHARCFMGATEHEGSIVVTGGINEHRDYDSVEVYDFLLNRWKMISSLCGMYASGLVSCRGMLYALGGNGYIVDRLRDLQQTWERCPSMLHPRRFFAAVSCQNSIYAIGGKYGSNQCTKSVEKLDPDVNKWVYVSEMHTERSAHAACVMQGKIYVVGGKDASGKAVKTIECYDVLLDSWSIVGEINVDLYSHSIFVL